MTILPPDIVSVILLQLDGPFDVLAASQVSSMWRAVVLNPQYGVCRYHCSKFYRLILDTSPKPNEDWYQVFLQRLRRISRCTALLEKVLEQSTGTIRHIEQIVALGPELKDTIINFWSTVNPDRALSQEYYSRVIYQKICRTEARALFERLNRNDDVFYDEALSAFSLFWPATVQDAFKLDTEFTRNRLDELAFEARTMMGNNPDKSLPARVESICEVMKQNGIVAARDSDYYAVENSFIHLALQGHGSLPITMAIIFAGIARRCGISAAPINYPGHVFIAVSPSSEFREEDIFYVDVFNGGTIHRHRALPGPFEDVETAADGALKPSSISSMMCRVSRNIANAINGRPTMNGLELSWFAALSSVTILEPDDYLFGRLCDVIRTHPSLSQTDVDIIEAACATGWFEGSDDHKEFCRQARHFDEIGRPPRLKSEDFWMVRFGLGQIFEHRLFQYVGVIYGYDKTCSQSDGWKANMQVSRLPRGEEQPFYHVLAEDGSARYVGEDNICLLRDYSDHSITSLCNLKEIGRYFRRYNAAERRFVPNPSLAIEYPDSDS